MSLMKDSVDLARMPNTLYGQTLNQPVVSPDWGSAIETAVIVTVVHDWQAYAAFLLIAVILSVVARGRNAQNAVRPTDESMPHHWHWPGWHGHTA